MSTGESTPGNQPEPFTRGWTMGIAPPAPTILQQPAASSIMRPHDHFKHAASPIAQSVRQMPQAVPVPEKPMMEAANPRSFTPDSERPSTSGVKQLVRSFEDLSPSQTKLNRTPHDDWILDNPFLFRPGVMDEVAERMGVKLKPGMKKKGGEEKASFIKQKLAERRGKGEARTKNLGI